jgi:phosphotransferase system enzyme I (PtsI)
MAADPLHALVLVGLGLTELSMSPAAIPRVKAAVRATRASRAREVALACLALRTAEEIDQALARELAPGLAPAPTSKE